MNHLLLEWLWFLIQDADVEDTVVIDVLYVIGLIALLYALLWFIDHPWEFPLQPRVQRVRKAHEYLVRIDQGRENWPDMPRINGRYVDSVRRRYLDV